MSWFHEIFGGGRPAQSLPHLRPELRQMQAYWQSLRPGVDIPDRADFDPRAIASLLEHCLLLERIAPGQARIRLAGMRVNALMGTDLRGMPLFSLIAPGTRDRFRPMVEAVFARPAVVTLHLESERGLMRGNVSGQMALFPMRGRHGHINRALGVIVTEGESTRLPRRFDLSSARLDPIALPGTAEPDETAPARSVQRVVGGLGEPCALPFPHDLPTLAVRGHLRLVHSR
jgi:hypothetical protein